MKRSGGAFSTGAAFWIYKASVLREDCEINTNLRTSNRGRQIITGAFNALIVSVLAGISLCELAPEALRSTHTTEASDVMARLITPQLAGVRVFFRDEAVDQVTSGKKIKKYSLELTGSGFVSGSRIVMASFRAFPVTIGEPPQQPVTSSFESSSSLRAAFLPSDSPPPGVLSINVVNPDWTKYNSMTIDLISKQARIS